MFRKSVLEKCLHYGPTFFAGAATPHIAQYLKSSPNNTINAEYLKKYHDEKTGSRSQKKYAGESALKQNEDSLPPKRGFPKTR